MTSNIFRSPWFYIILGLVIILVILYLVLFTCNNQGKKYVIKNGIEQFSNVKMIQV